MDILNLVEYEREHPVALKHPVTGDALGVVINVVSMESNSAAKAVRAERQKFVERRIAGESVDASEESDAIDMAMYCAVVKSWDWGGKAPGPGFDVDPVCDKANKVKLFSHQNSKWIKEQIAEGCTRIANFTQAE